MTIGERHDAGGREIGEELLCISAGSDAGRARDDVRAAVFRQVTARQGPDEIEVPGAHASLNA
jgi:hypothetical protein